MVEFVALGVVQLKVVNNAANIHLRKPEPMQ